MQGIGPTGTLLYEAWQSPCGQSAILRRLPGGRGLGLLFAGTITAIGAGMLADPAGETASGSCLLVSSVVVTNSRASVHHRPPPAQQSPDPKTVHGRVRIPAPTGHLRPFRSWQI